MKHYYDKPYANTRMLLFDMEYLVENANLTDIEQFLLE